MPGTKQDTICHPSSLPPSRPALPSLAEHPFCQPTLQMHGYRYRVNVQGFCGIYFALHFTFAAPRNRFAADSLLLLSFLFFSLLFVSNLHIGVAIVVAFRILLVTCAATQAGPAALSSALPMSVPLSLCPVVLATSGKFVAFSRFGLHSPRTMA